MLTGYMIREGWDGRAYGDHTCRCHKPVARLTNQKSTLTRGAHSPWHTAIESKVLLVAYHRRVLLCRDCGTRLDQHSRHDSALYIERTSSRLQVLYRLETCLSLEQRVWTIRFPFQQSVPYLRLFPDFEANHSGH